MSAPSYVVSVSLGKDSTEMLCGMLERGENVIAAVYFDTGWEFPQMPAHLERLERYTGLKIVTLKPRESFDYVFRDRQKLRGKFKKKGYGWPSFFRRWCTAMKRDAIKAYCNALSWQGYNLPIVQCIGFAVDEPQRIAEYLGKKPVAYQEFRFPLAEWGITEAQALESCKARGFSWDGLYDHFRRVSCFCCPLQGLDELRTLRLHFPDLWARMLKMESWLPVDDLGRRFNDKKTVSDLDARFATENCCPVKSATEMIDLPGFDRGAGESHARL